MSNAPQHQRCDSQDSITICTLPTQEWSCDLAHSTGVSFKVFPLWALFIHLHAKVIHVSHVLSLMQIGSGNDDHSELVDVEQGREEKEQQEEAPVGYVSRRTTDPYMKKKLRGLQV